MKVGDLVKIKLEDSDPRDRDVGVITQLNWYESEWSGEKELLAEVLWTGALSWILADRIEKIKKV